jgi:murein DD-endopeptidase MepM/ murein hydrolase activator NlpD
MGDGLFGSHRKGNRLHQGIDFFAPVGTPILASRSGIVISTKRNPGMGNYIIIRHSPALITIYGHLSRIYVTKGKFVRQGEIIGAAGKTGNANYQGILSHLHFEIRKNGIPQDPLEYLE